MDKHISLLRLFTQRVHVEMIWPPGVAVDSGARARAKRARSGAPLVRKFGKLSIRVNLIVT